MEVETDANATANATANVEVPAPVAAPAPVPQQHKKLTVTMLVEHADPNDPTNIKRETVTASVNAHIVKLSTLIATMLEDDEEVESQVIPLNCTPTELAVIDRYVTYIAERGGDELVIEKPLRETTKTIKDAVGEQHEWLATFADEIFTANDDYALFFELLVTSHYLGMDKLKSLLSCRLALDLRGKTKKEVEEMFAVEPATPEEEEAIRAANPWIFDIPLAIASARVGHT